MTSTVSCSQRFLQVVHSAGPGWLHAVHQAVGKMEASSQVDAHPSTDNFEYRHKQQRVLPSTEHFTSEAESTNDRVEEVGSEQQHPGIAEVKVARLSPEAVSIGQTHGMISSPAEAGESPYQGRSEVFNCAENDAVGEGEDCECTIVWNSLSLTANVDATVNNTCHILGSDEPWNGASDGFAEQVAATESCKQKRKASSSAQIQDCSTIDGPALQLTSATQGNVLWSSHDH